MSRGFAGDVTHLTELIKKAIQHKGFSLVDVLQPCVSFNKLNTFSWYSERVYKMEEDDADYDPGDRVKAFGRSLEWGERIPLGIFYVNEKPTFEDNLEVLRSGPLVRNKANPKKVDELLDRFI